jgi:hypothetical protein
MSDTERKTNGHSEILSQCKNREVGRHAEGGQRDERKEQVWCKGEPLLLSRHSDCSY